MTITIDVGQGKTTIIDDIDADLAKLPWHVLSKRYVARRLSLKQGRGYIFLHHVIFERKYGYKSSQEKQADHKDLDIYNNTRDNIRVATHAESMRNRKPYGKSGFKGVYPNGKKWAGYITVNKKKFYLGTFETPEEAHEAYKKAAIEFAYGDFAKYE